MPYAYNKVPDIQNSNEYLNCTEVTSETQFFDP
jgi:hypothetical protein